ncbi:MAG: ATP-binding protein [Opitutae bacterium]|jgi:hypothetical protein|nr:ATP-binding protein [Opitutae bacterium]
MKNFEECPPNADAMVQSMRAFGYDMGTAIADLIDNSIFAQASSVKISYEWNGGDPWVAIMDNGKGMNEKELYEAMRPSSTSAMEKRDEADLGRFGLGLKTASWSQCKYMVVVTKKSRKTTTRFWDLNHVDKTKKWSLGKNPKGKYMKLLEPLKKQSSGTMVIWGNLDRLVDSPETDSFNPEKAFLNKFIQIRNYLEMIFHMYLEDRSRKFGIHIGIHQCKPWDPFMLKNDYTQCIYQEKYEGQRVQVTPYILPHVSHRTSKEKECGGGLRGWSEQQGFYIYRNKRMIVSGGWLDLDELTVKDEYKLARIRVNISNDMDQEWGLDVRKAKASPPDRLRSELTRIAKVARRHAVSIYKARISSGKLTGPRKKRKEIWVKDRKGDKIVYRLNQSHPILERLLDEDGVTKKSIKNLCHLIESTIPHREIIMDDREEEDCHVDLPENLLKPPKGFLDLCRENYEAQLEGGLSHEEAVDVVCSLQPFNMHLAYRVMLDGLAEN